MSFDEEVSAELKMLRVLLWTYKVTVSLPTSAEEGNNQIRYEPTFHITLWLGYIWSTYPTQSNFLWRPTLLRKATHVLSSLLATQEYHPRGMDPGVQHHRLQVGRLYGWTAQEPSSSQEA
jgi:hypothetical protein